MENWKEQVDDEGRSFVEFIREEVDRCITCVACSMKINHKDDLDVIDKIYSHTRTIEHGFKLFVMINTKLMDVIDLTEDRENWSPKPKETNVEIARNKNGTLQIYGFNPVSYVIPIVDLPFIKKKIRESERKTVLSSLDNYFTTPTKRKQSDGESNSSEQNSVSSIDQVTSPKKRKTAQLTLERWVKNDECRTFDENTWPQNTPQQQGQSVTKLSSLLSEGLTRISEVRPAKRGINQVIRARVAIKSDIHPFFNFLGPTTMFSLDLIDESGEIRVSAYGEIANKLYPLIEVGRIYCFSKFNVKASDPSKAPVISSFNIKFTEETIIRPCVMPVDIPKMQFDFKPIASVATMSKDDIVDVLGIIESFGQVQVKRLSNGSPGRNREVWLVDQSHTKIVLYIWGSNADNFEPNRPGDVMAVKRAKVKNFAKLNLDSSCLSSSTFEINPRRPEADALRKWYSEKKNASLKVLSSVPRPRASIR